MDSVRQSIEQTCKELFGEDVKVDLARTEEKFGDFSTNVALQLASRQNKNPREIAQLVAEHLQDTDGIREVSVAGPGFVNLTLTDEMLWSQVNQVPAKSLQGKEILVEFGDPNPFKAMHLGHLYTAIVGNSIASLFEVLGADVKRLSYHGDVGMHVAKCLWAVGEHIGWDTKKLEGLRLDDSDISNFYVIGANAYKEDETSAEAIKAVNASIYLADRKDINEIYELLRKKSFEEFDKIFNKLGIKYDKRYLESQSAKTGDEWVRQNVGKVFEESDGAIVYKGEKAGLHTRVFINSRGLPTYEAKDLGLTKLKQQDYPDSARSIIITANEQTEYFKVMLAALKEIEPALADKTTHIPHGFLSLTTGKMSSRTGNIFAAADLLKIVSDTTKSLYPRADLDSTQTDMAALKYAFLKQRIGGDIVFDVKESVALDGNSGPYIQYAYARANSILSKAGVNKPEVSLRDLALEPGERTFACKLSEYTEAIQRATNDLMPHHICTYLYELSQAFNRFYENNRVIGETRQNLRLKLVGYYANTLKSGLGLLNITAPDKM